MHTIMAVSHSFLMILQLPFFLRKSSIVNCVCILIQNLNPDYFFIYNAEKNGYLEILQCENASVSFE